MPPKKVTKPVEIEKPVEVKPVKKSTKKDIEKPVEVKPVEVKPVKKSVKKSEPPAVQVSPPEARRGRPKMEKPVIEGDSKYNKPYYDSHKFDIAKKRILNKLEKGQPVSEKMLKKYEIGPTGH
jgi:hypothetical protein